MKYEDAHAHYGTHTALARAIDKDVRVVHKWSRRGIPLDGQVLIEAATGGKLQADLPQYFRKQAA